MTQTPPRLEFYLGWLDLRRVARSEGVLVEPSLPAIMSLCDRIDTLLQLDIDHDHRRDLERALVRVRVSQLALRRVYAHLADLLGVVVSDPAAPLGRPSIDQITYARLLQLAQHIDEYEHTTGEGLWAGRLAARANVSLDRVHAAIVWMLADGVAHLPAGDDQDRVDTFRLSGRCSSMLLKAAMKSMEHQHIRCSCHLVDTELQPATRTIAPDATDAITSATPIARSQVARGGRITSIIEIAASGTATVATGSDGASTIPPTVIAAKAAASTRSSNDAA